MQDNPHFYYRGNFFNAENVPHLFFLKNTKSHMSYENQKNKKNIMQNGIFVE